MALDLKDTLNLPKTNFPMRANLAKREPGRIDHWEKIRVYQRGLEQNEKNTPFILHDGPPFTNGDIHLGHVLNKVLKDFVVRQKTMAGHFSPYVPGWDCHGLPIESRVSKGLEAQGKSLPPDKVREECDAFSEKFIGIQKEQFRRLGNLTDWNIEYKTKDPAYEAEILRTFASFVEQGLVYRGKKPVYWSIPEKTALAEAEIEYKDHVSPSIYVKFKLNDAAKLGLSDNTYVVIWTTTPWTLPANLAVAAHPKFDYQAVTKDGETLILATELVDAVTQTIGWEDFERGPTFKGDVFDRMSAQHPFLDRESLLVNADYVTTESGTGLVHTAPGHGLDDYFTGLKYGLEVYNPLDDNGCYIDDGKIPPNLVGKTVHEPIAGKFSEANSLILRIISDNGSLLKMEKYRHQYPHCWRSKTPVVFRAMDQWFVRLDHNGLRQRTLDSIGEVSWTPAYGENRIRAAVENRPDWCISRQRRWGVPLPAFFDDDKNPLLDAEVIRAVADKVATEGTNLWFREDAATILDGIDLPAEFVGKPLTKSMDTLDVWIDSGCSHVAVLKQFDQLSWPADLYLEGSDQHRGWFQSSLWTSQVAYQNTPYKGVLTHGFIVNPDGTKLAKSAGAETAGTAIKKYGVDVLRLWIASLDYRTDVPISQDILKGVMDSYRSIRNTLRYLLSNQFDFDFERDAVPYESLLPLDAWALYKLQELHEPIMTAYEKYEFHKVYQTCVIFAGNTLSRLYHDALKNRLYTMRPDHPSRRSAQTVLYHIFRYLNRYLAPIIPFTTDEAFAYWKEDADYSEDSIHLERFTAPPSEWNNAGIAADFEQLLSVREQVNDRLESLRKDKKIGQGLDADVLISIDFESDLGKVLRKYADIQIHEGYPCSLEELFIVSRVDLHHVDGQELSVQASPARGVRCPRSWIWVDELVDSPYGQVGAHNLDALNHFQPV